jgi:hypothetical protein
LPVIPLRAGAKQGENRMNLTPDIKERIDEMPYAQMLSCWRFAPIGDPMFQGEVGEYFRKEMLEKRNTEDNPASTSKAVGWERSAGPAM